MDCKECGQMFMHDDIVTVPEYTYDRPVGGELLGRRLRLPGLVTVHAQCARNHPHRFAGRLPDSAGGTLREH